jgi:hypothetical protein
MTLYGGTRRVFVFSFGFVSTITSVIGPSSLMSQPLDEPLAA